MNESNKQKWAKIQGEESFNGFFTALQRFIAKNNVNMKPEKEEPQSVIEKLCEYMTNQDNQMGVQFMHTIDSAILDDSTMVKYAIIYEDEALFRKAIRLIVHASTLNFLEDNRIEMLSAIRKLRGLDPKTTD